MFVIEGKEIKFSYQFGTTDSLVINDVNLSISKGEYVAFLGHNGCGKSTLVKHFNALLPLQQGELLVDEMNVRDNDIVWKLRRTCGMVFQNPDNQFVSSVIEEDIAFGLENYQIARDKIPQRIKDVLHIVGMDGYEKRSPHTLSGGQKQRIALAGVLVLNPQILIFDEITAMLDPESRNEVLSTIRRLRQQENKTIILITHYVEEAMDADKIIIIDKGKVLAAGTPREILTDIKLLSSVEIVPPMPVRIYNDLQKTGICLRKCPLTEEELVEELCQLK